MKQEASKAQALSDASEEQIMPEAPNHRELERPMTCADCWHVKRDDSSPLEIKCEKYGMATHYKMICDGINLIKDEEAPE